LDKTARLWQLDPIVLMPADQREGYVCRKLLVGAQSFTGSEMEEPMLSGHDDLRNPCDRAGPLSLDYYWRVIARFWPTRTLQMSGDVIRPVIITQLSLMGAHSPAN
jgi:hypothetical protein